MMQINTVFAVPLIWFNIPADPIFIANLRQVLLQIEAQGTRFANPNPYTQRNEHLFESNFDLFDFDTPELKQLQQMVGQALLHTVAQLNQYPPSAMQQIQPSMDAWFHVTRRGGFFGIHNHPMASWSGVYCVDGGDDEGVGHADHGQICFINPFITNNMFCDPGNSQLKQPFNSGSQLFRLKTGQMVLFPSWLLHEVKPYLGKRERITVAFNAWFHQRS